MSLKNTPIPSVLRYPSIKKSTIPSMILNTVFFISVTDRKGWQCSEARTELATPPGYTQNCPNGLDLSYRLSVYFLDLF